MNYWIFQSNPDYFDPRTSRKVANKSEDEWLASRYRTDMTEGDRVYFWIAGDPSIRGIHATGHLIGLPYQRGEKHYVRVKYERLLLHPVTIAAIEKERRLTNLWILKMALGTNFLINQQEGLAIQDLIRRAEK